MARKVPVEGSVGAAPSSPRSVWPWLGLVAGLLMAQGAWIFLIPPFDGQDEHDHAFKAAAVARGDWGGAHDRVEVGRGALMAVPEDIVTAALPACEALPYTQRDDCNPSATLPDGQVLVATSFAPTHPAFYALVGTAALPFEGAAAGYAMRVAGSVLCTTMMVAAFAVIRRTSRTQWPATGFLLLLTPAMMYATSLPAPNGPEMAAGLLLWSTLLFGSTESAPAPRWVIAAGTTAAVLLATVRTIGPLWLGLCVLVAVMYHGVPWALERLRDRSLWPAYAVVVLAVMAGAAWTLLFSPNDPENESGPQFVGSAWPYMPSAGVVWLIQLVAAIPRRNSMVPISVYAVVLAAWTVMLCVACWRGHRAVRWSIAAIFVSTTGVSIALTVATYTEIGLAWQGRYSWPFVLGWLLLAAHSLERRRASGDLSALVMSGAVAAFSLTTSVVGVRSKLLARGVADASWTAPSTQLVALLTLSGVLLTVGALATLRVKQPVSARQDAADDAPALV